MHLSTLNTWLDWIGSVHNKDIDLGLERIREAAGRLQLLQPKCPVIIVGGTNGKGSVVAGLEAVYMAAGYHTGAFTSPVLLVHNEEVRVNGIMADDAAFCRAFEKIEAARNGVSLTPFEYHTLAALLIFAESNLDVMILEVGLGGRLDAVNLMDADAVVITSIGIDHVDWLGHTREAIAIEKAGIFRHGKPAICGDDAPPASLIKAAHDAGVDYYQRGVHFHFHEENDDWNWYTDNIRFEHLPKNVLLTENMASVLMTISTLQSRLPVDENAVRRGLQNIVLPGRIQKIQGPVLEIYDVSHNPSAAAMLARKLTETLCAGKMRAVFSMLEDKDIAGTAAEMRSVADEWHVAPLACKRAAPQSRLKEVLKDYPAVQFYQSVADAYGAAFAHSQPGDRLVIFGSFYTVAAVMRLKRRQLLAPVL